MLHEPVLLNETIECLNLQQGATVVDGTLGSGGHTAAILKKIGDQGRLIAFDHDPVAIANGQCTFQRCRQISFHQDSFVNAGQVLGKLNIHQVDAVILDVGLSSDQLADESRGFSFLREGPLDMRMNPSLRIRARDLANDLSQVELERIFREFGEEWRAKRFSQAIFRERQRDPI